ncbi:MAG: hypothetical protein RLZZ241_76 [Bacteroidota bacterium]|jgi:CBS domain-containing protein
MYLSELLNTAIPVYEPEDSLKEVILYFEHSTHSHVGVVESGLFLGLLGEDDIDSFKESDRIESYRYQLESFYVRSEDSWLDVMEAFARNTANVMPVVSEQGKMLGYYDLADVMGIFRDMPFYTEQGVVLILSRAIRDYSFSEIAQIVEGNNAKLFGAVISGKAEESVEITLKMSHENTGEVLSALRRYGYTIVSGSSDDAYLEELKSRSAYLVKYLKV